MDCRPRYTKGTTLLLAGIGRSHGPGPPLSYKRDQDSGGRRNRSYWKQGAPVELPSTGSLQGRAAVVPEPLVPPGVDVHLAARPRSRQSCREHNRRKPDRTLSRPDQVLALEPRESAHRACKGRAFSESRRSRTFLRRSRRPATLENKPGESDRATAVV